MLNQLRKRLNGSIDRSKVNGAIYPATMALTLPGPNGAAPTDDVAAITPGVGNAAGPVLAASFAGVIARSEGENIAGTDNSEGWGPHREDIVHDTLKGMDVWFGFRVSELEKEAVRSAQAMADRGLPRHDLDSQEPLEVEKELGQRANQVYWQWVREVRRRVEGALAKELRTAAAALTDLSASLAAYRGIQDEIGVLSPRQRGSRTEPASAAETALQESSNRTPVAHPSPGALRETKLLERQLHAWFWPFVLVLIAVEFFANAPIFAELFPQDAQLDGKLREWLDPAAPMSWLTGVTHLAAKIVTYPDAALVAFGVILFLLFLGHHLGAEVRVWTMLSKPHPEIPQELAAQLERQARLVVCACGIGIVLALGVLYQARAMVHPMAEARYTDVVSRATVAEEELRDARRDPDNRDVPSARGRYNELVEERDHRSRRLDYASSIRVMNLPILGLNGVLVLAAALAGFSRRILVVSSEQKLGHVVTTFQTITPSGSEPSVSGSGSDSVPSERIEELRIALRTKRGEMAVALNAADRALGRARQLVASDPMREWRGVTSRLQCAIPMFRSENARLRNLDSRDIRAFQTPAVLEFDQQKCDCAPELLTQLSDHSDRLETLSAVCEAFSTGVRVERSVPAMADATSVARSRDAGGAA